MALDPLIVRIAVDTRAFDAAIRRTLEILDTAWPWLWRIKLDQQRHRSRLVTRRKQRSRW